MRVYFEVIISGGNLYLAGSDAIELRVDLLASTDIAFIKEQVFLLKIHSQLPIIYTVRSADQGGAFKGSDEEAFALLGVSISPPFLASNHFDFLNFS